jgi:GNAT superfamily N-acetyltransferase
MDVKHHDPRGFVFPLRDGTPVLLRPVLPEDRARIVTGFDELSRVSRYLRFFSGINRLTDEQLAYLSEVDQVQHVAWGALDPMQDGLPGLGLGRFHRMENRPDAAEFAVVVADRIARRGLGSILLGVLYLQAIDLGIRTLCASVLPENVTVFDWLLNLGASVVCNQQLCELTLDVHRDFSHLPDTSSSRRFGELLERLRHERLTS